METLKLLPFVNSFQLHRNSETCIIAVIYFHATQPEWLILLKFIAGVQNGQPSLTY